MSPSEPPTLEPVEFQNDIMAAQGSEVVLPCEARGSPLPLVSWMKDGEPLLPQILEHGPGLKLEAVSIGDSGTYSCMAASEAGEARRHFRLTVMGGCLVLSGFGGWRVRWDSGAEQKPVRKGSSLEVWGQLCVRLQRGASLVLPAELLRLRSRVLFSSIPTFLTTRPLVSKTKARAINM